MNGVVEEVVGKRNYLVRFLDGLQKQMSSKYITIVVVRSEVEQEIKVSQVEMIPEVREELGCYHLVYNYLNFIKQCGVDNREQQVGVEPDSDEVVIKYVVPYDERDIHWRIIFEDNSGGVDGKKALLHAKKWDDYNQEKEALSKFGYSIGVA